MGIIQHTLTFSSRYYTHQHFLCQLSYATVQKLTSAFESGLPQPPPPYLYEKHNFVANEIDDDIPVKVQAVPELFDQTNLHGNS